MSQEIFLPKPKCNTNHFAPPLSERASERMWPSATDAEAATVVEPCVLCARRMRLWNFSPCPRPRIRGESQRSQQASVDREDLPVHVIRSARREEDRGADELR